MEDELILSEQDRSKLDGVVSKMIANKEPEANIQFVVNDFKQKYSVKKKEPSEASGSLFSAEPSASDTSSEVPAAFGEIPKFEGSNQEDVSEVDTPNWYNVAKSSLGQTYEIGKSALLKAASYASPLSTPLTREEIDVQAKSAIDKIRDEGPKFDQTFTESIAQGKFGDAALQAEEFLLGTAPLAITSAAITLGTGGLGAPVSLALMGGYGAQSAHLDAKGEKFYEDMSPLMRAGYTSAMGGLEVLGEGIGGKILSGAVKKLAAQQITKKAFEQTAKEIAKGALKSNGVAVTEEALAEFTTGFGQSAVDQYARTGDVNLGDAFRQGFEGAAMGAVGGAVFNTPSTIADATALANSVGRDMKNAKARTEINKYKEKLDASSTVEEQDYYSQKLAESIKTRTRNATDDAKFYEYVGTQNPQDLERFLEIDNEIKRYASIAKVIKDTEATKDIKAKVGGLIQQQKDLESKYSAYDTQEEAGIPSPIVEGEAPIEVQPIQVASGTSPEADRLLQVLGEQEVFQKIAEAQEVDNIEAQAAQQQILNAIDEVDALDIADDVKTAYIQTLEDKFDDIEYYDNKTITTTEQVTEEVPIGAPRAGSRTIVEPEVRRGKFRLFERLNNLEVAVGTETEGQTSVIETQEDGSIDVITYDKATKQEVSRQPKVAENILGLEYVESILDDNGELTGVVMRPRTPKGEDISPVRIQVVNRPELALDIAIDARKKEIGDVPEVIWMQEYETVTRDVTTKERVPAAKRPERKAARVVLPTETVVAEQVTEQVVEQEPVKNNKGLSSEQVTEAVSAAERLARRLGLPTKIVVHNSRKEFNDAMDEVSKSGSVASGVESGRFIPSANEIHLNLEDMTLEVPFHEVFHAAFVNRFAKASQATREKIASDFQSGLLRVLRSGTAEDQQLADAVERFVQGGEYSAKESPEEFMAQTAGFIATSGKKISKTTMDKLIQWLNNFIGKISPSLKVTTRGEFIDFMNSFSGALFESGTDSRDVSEVVSEINEASSKQSDPKAISAALAIVNNVNNKYPEAVEQQVVSAEFKEDKFGKKGTLYDVKSIPYKLSDGAKKYFGENAVEKLSDKVVSDVKKYQGNKDISKGIGWYSNFRTQFQRKFGASLELFGQLLAATSAQTPVDINFRQAIDALRLYSKGSYDNLIKDYSKYVDSIEKMSRQDIIDSIEVRTKKKKTNYTDLDIINEKRKLINEFKDAPLQSNGKKFNANSAKVLQAIYGNWLSQTQGPKTKNFAGNLTGRSYEATIDVWAARYLRRIIYKDNISRWRIHPKQEGAVEHTVSVDGVTGGDYFFAEEVMRKAAEKLNWNADDLQAFLWFLEKDIWGRNNWTGAAGRKKSSFEEEAEKLLTERYQAGVTTFKDFDTFNKEEFEAAKVELLNTIRAVDGLIVGRVVESEGEYYSPSGDVYAEPTFDVEFSVDEGTDVSSIEAKVIEIGKRYNQEAVLFSKITEKKEKNSAPIIEIGLKNPSKNSKTIESIKKMLSGLGVRGFTVSRDSRGNILGVRTQYIKEFEGQPISFGEILFSSAEKELRNQFEKNNDISYISSNFVETNVTFTENEKATEIPSDAKAKDDAAITGGLESSSRVAGEPSGPSRAGATGGITESSSSQANKSYDELLESSSKQQVQLGIQQSQINYNIDKQLAESKSWQERERTEMERYMDLARIKIQDKLYGVIKLQEDIEYSTGKPVGLDQDFRNAEVLMHGKAASDLTKSMEKAEKVVEDVKKSGVTLDEFDQLLYALHAQERNRNIRIQRTNIAESITDLRKKNKLSLSEISEMSGIDIETYKELEAGTAKKGITSEELNSILSAYGITLSEFYTQYSRENAGSGMTDIDAQTILSTYGLNALRPNVKDLKPALRDAVNGVYAIIEDSRERMLDYGLETLDTVVAFESLYSNYVPLRGFEGEDSASEILGGGRSLEVRGREKRALGRKSKADSPFLTAVAQNQSTIVRARKNEVAQKLYKLAESNPNNQIWKVIDPSVNKEYKKKATSKGIKDVAKTISDYILDNRNFAVRIDGEYKFVQFTDTRMAEALRGANVVKADFIVKYLGGFNRLLSSFITTYDPEFVLRNFSRDIQVAVINAVAEQEIEGGLLKGKDITGKIVKSVPKSIKAIFNMSKKGVKPSNEFEQYYADFLEDGAKTEWFYSKSIDELRSDIDKLVNGKGKNAIQAAGNFVERINTSVENGVRLAAYMEARKAGLSRDKAAELAKNLTVNFNKSGEWGTVANSLYLFFNASVQGTSRLIRTLKPQFKKNDDGTRSLQVTTAQKIAISMFIAGSLMSLLNEALSDDDEDGKSFYSKIPDFEKERNIIIMTGKDYIKIPLPYGLNVFYVAGNAMADAGQGIKTVGEVATNILQAAIGSFSPINFPSSEDFSSWIMKFITPTVGQIPLSLALNEDYFGRTIYNKNFPTDPTPKPESELGRKGGTEMNSWIAKELNKLTGGSELRSGVIDINPDKIDFFLETISGGAGKFALRSSSTIGNLITGNWDQIESNNVPGLRVFYGQPRKFVDLQSYFDKRIEVNQFMEEVKAGDITGPESNSIKQVYRINKAVDRALRNLRKAEKTAEGLEDPEQRENRLNELERKRYAQIASFQKAYEEYKIDKL